MTNSFNRSNTKAAKLKAEQVIELKRLYAEGWSQGRLSREFQISVGQIGRIVRGESWQWQAAIQTEHARERIPWEAQAADAEFWAKAAQTPQPADQGSGAGGTEPKASEPPSSPLLQRLEAEISARRRAAADQDKLIDELLKPEGDSK